MKKSKKNWIQEQCITINEDMARGRSHNRAYNTYNSYKPYKKKNHDNRIP